MGFIPFQNLFHADWSAAPKKRWVAAARRKGTSWDVAPAHPVHDTRAFAEELFTTAGPVLAGRRSVRQPLANAAYGKNRYQTSEASGR
jgi:hypothetical protein